MSELTAQNYGEATSCKMDNTRKLMDNFLSGERTSYNQLQVNMLNVQVITIQEINAGSELRDGSTRDCARR